MTLGASAETSSRLQTDEKVMVRVRVGSGPEGEHTFLRGTTVGSLYEHLSIDRKLMAVINKDYAHPVGSCSIYHIRENDTVHFGAPFRIQIYDAYADQELSQIELPVVGLNLSEVMSIVETALPDLDFLPAVILNGIAIADKVLLTETALHEEDELGMLDP